MPTLNNEQYDELLATMRHIPPIRNINAMHAWLSKCRPDLVRMFEMVTKGAAAGHEQAKNLILLMMTAFAAGRTYQEANPDAQRDPDGYGG